MIEVKIWGGAGEAGRSCYYIKGSESSIILDCGVKKVNSGEYPLLEPDEVPKVDAVFLSHAHEDHAMAIPLLYRLGYEGRVLTSELTEKQLPLYANAWNKFVSEQHGQLPFDDEDVQRIKIQNVEQMGERLRWIRLNSNISFIWGRSGHMVGAIWFIIKIEGHTIFFSGDYTTESELLHHDAPKLFDDLNVEKVDLAIVDSSYGTNKQTNTQLVAQLCDQISETLRIGGTVLLPVPASGRGQDLLLIIRTAFPQANLIVEDAILRVLNEYQRASDWLRETVWERISNVFSSEHIKVVKTDQEREQAMSLQGSKIIFTTDGMMQTNEAKSYYAKIKNEPNHRVILTGHLAKGSFGERLYLNGKAKFIRYKVHQGLHDVGEMLANLQPKHTILVHADKMATDALVEKLMMKGYTGLYALLPGESKKFD